MNLEEKLLAMLNRLSVGANDTGAARAAGERLEFLRECERNSKAGEQHYVVEWQGSSRQFCEQAEYARRVGRVAREQYLRGVTINGEVQYVLDPALLKRFGYPGEPLAQEMLEIHGYPDFYARDVDGNKIPLLSARHPRPERHRHAHPHTGRYGTFPKEPLPTWTPEMPVPAYARTVKAPAPPPPVIPRTESSPLAIELREKARLLKERGPQNPRPMSRDGMPMAPAIMTAPRTDDPKENNA